MIAIGLDGFKKGWVAVTLDGDKQSNAFPTDISWLANQSFDRAAIDIPIGMNDDGERCCDREARRLLQPHGARVFGGARRWLWEKFTDPDLANPEAWRQGQKGVSRQLWHLGPKIMQVDTFLRVHPACHIRETHSELVFWRLNGEQPLPSKRTAEGSRLRRQRLRERGISEVDIWVDQVRLGTGAKADDVLDACACALVARDSDRFVPLGAPPRDDHGLSMQIWY